VGTHFSSPKAAGAPRSICAAPQNHTRFAIDDWMAMNIRIGTVFPHPWTLARGNKVLLPAGGASEMPAQFLANFR